MDSPLLTYLLLGVCGLLFAGSFWMSSERAPVSLRKLSKLSAVLQLVALLGAYLVLRPGPSSDVRELQEMAKKEGKLLFLSFHSNN